MTTPSAAPAQPDSVATRTYLSQIGTHLGMPPGILGSLQSGEPFVGPSGLLCRIHVRRDEDRWAAYPEVLLPLAAAELGGMDVPRLLGVQEQLLGGEGWLLGLMEDGGLLGLRPLQARHDAARVAADMDRGHLLARAALDALVPPGDSAPSGAGPAAAPAEGAAP
ncbi:hypothetical protein [Acidovorax sacchari]|uniref:hypothetical protein n=1 Tax=Acidovorax sacchari TaxID=3230736 RepID=UPI0039E58E6C